MPAGHSVAPGGGPAPIPGPPGGDPNNPLKPNFDPQKDRDLGLQIIESLTRGDLNGEFTLRTEGDQTVATIVFPKR